MAKSALPRAVFVAAATMTLTGCATLPANPAAPARDDGIARLGVAEHVDGLTVTPLRVIEDSRCPAGVRCVWAGRVVVAARVALGTGDRTLELVLGEPVPIADGQLTLTAVAPERRDGAAGGAEIAPADYRFTLRFDGGL